MLEKFWHQISYNGLTNLEKDRRDLILLNKMAFILMSLALFVTLVEVLNLIFFDVPMRFGSQRIILTWIISFICILLNRQRFFLSGKLILTLVPVLILTLYPLLFLDFRDEYILFNPIIVIAFSVIPHLLFTSSNEKPYYYGSLIYLLILILISDIVYLKAGSVSLSIYQEMINNLFYHKLAHLSSFAFINAGIIYFKKLTEKSESELENKNLQLKEHKEELLAQNEELIAYQEELHAKNEALTESMRQLEDTQTQLIMSEKMASLGQLMAGIAHEINNPVNYIQTGVTGLKEILTDIDELIEIIDAHKDDASTNTCKKIILFTEKVDLATTKEDIKIIADNIFEGINRTSEIIKGLRQFSYQSDEKFMFYDIHEAINTALVLLHNKYKNHIYIETEYKEIPMVECLPGYINQAILNILDNAISAIREKGVITIKTRMGDEGIIIEIHDNGPGIPHEIQQKIFEPFFTTKEIGKGTGLGLSITYDIIQRHNGKIWLESSLRQGTSFFILLKTPSDH